MQFIILAFNNFLSNRRAKEEPVANLFGVSDPNRFNYKQKLHAKPASNAPGIEELMVSKVARMQNNETLHPFPYTARWSVWGAGTSSHLCGTTPRLRVKRTVAKFY
jgi:hypothetical protein